MSPQLKHLSRVAIVLTLTALGFVHAAMRGAVSAQSSRTDGGYSLLRGAIDIHLHVDPDVSEMESVDATDIAKLRFARDQGIRGVVLKNHYGTTDLLAYIVRKEVPGIDVFGGVTLNLNAGGINLSQVEYMATQMRGRPGQMVWMPTHDAENAVRRSKHPDAPFVRVAQNGELLPR